MGTKGLNSNPASVTSKFYGFRKVKIKLSGLGFSSVMWDDDNTWQTYLPEPV